MYSYSWMWLFPGIDSTGGALGEMFMVHDEAANAHAFPAALFACLLCIMFALAARAGLSSARAQGGNMQYVPDTGFSPRGIAELVVGGLFDFAQGVLHRKSATRKYFPLYATVFIFVLVGNLMGVVPGFLPPTSAISTNFAIALCVFLVFNYVGISENGLVGYLKHFGVVSGFMAFIIFPFEFFSMLLRPLTLSLRLYINMFADHLLLGVSAEMPIIGYVLPIGFVGLGTFVSFIQAFVFMMLTVVYIQLSMSHDDHH